MSSLVIVPRTALARFGMCSLSLTVAGVAVELIVGEAFAVWVVGGVRWPAVVGAA